MRSSWKPLSVLVMLGAAVLTAHGLFAQADTEDGAQDLIIKAHEEREKAWPDTNLEHAFRQYWTAYSAANAEAMYAMEAPHFRFVITRERYQNYVDIVTRGGLTSLEYLTPRARSQSLYEIPLWLIRQGTDGELERIGLRDRWIRLGNSWYHVIKDPLAFPEMDGASSHHQRS